MRNTVGLCLLMLALVAACSEAPQTLEDGVWTGHLVSPTSEVFKVYYRVETSKDEAGEDTQTITLEWTRGPTMAYDYRRQQDTLWFSWNMDLDFKLNCILLRQLEVQFRGACRGPFGSFGLLTMAPPGVETDPDDIDADALVKIWDIVSVPALWVAEEEGRSEPEPQGISLDEAYAREALTGSPVDVEGNVQNLFQTGQGDVTIVFEAGLGDDFRVWSEVLQDSTLTTRLVAYDRAGLGYSDPGVGSRTPERLATELHRLLRTAEIAPPYVLVGHAEGGLIVRRFVSLYPDEVEGLVLVHPTHEAQGDRWKALSEEGWNDYARQQQTLRTILPPPARAEYEAFFDVLEDAEVPGLGGLPDVPTVVLTAMRPIEEPRWIGETEKGMQVKFDLHKALVDEASNATHLVTETSGPYIHREEPSRVVEAIQEVLGKIAGQ